MRISTLGIVLLGFLLIGCGDKESEAPAGDTTAPAADNKKKRADKDKDRGEASMTIGPLEWTADRVHATRKNNALTIKASRTDTSGDQVARQELHLVIPDVSGPGDYTVAPAGSLFIGVGIDIEAAKAAGDDDEATKDQATKALSNADMLQLFGTKVTITSASDTEVSGTFSWEPPTDDKPAITGGSFRAPIEQ